MKRSQSVISAFLLLLTPASSAVTSADVRIVVAASDVSYRQVPVKIHFNLPADSADAKVVLLRSSEGEQLIGQLTGPSLMDESRGTNTELHFIVPSLDKGESRVYTVSPADPSTETPSFRWTDNAGKYAQLAFDDRPVLRYMHQNLDESSEERREETYKVFHHVFDPASDQIVTKGPGGRYSHHRGLFYGFNRIRYGDQQADIWHCRRGESQQHRAATHADVGPVLGRHRVAIDWHGRDGKVFANEDREMTVYNIPGGHLIEFASRLSSRVPSLTLDGDPQHAGFQFRASQEVAAETKEQTYYLRPDGRGEPGQTRNWSDKNPGHANLPWNAQSFVLGDQRFTCCYLDHPENPKPARYSERDYGRFGSYFEHTLTPDHPLHVNYRIWLQRGEMDVHNVATLSHNFVMPPDVRPVVRD